MFDRTKFDFIKLTILVVSLISILVACSLSGKDDVTESNWWKDAVFYEIFVRSFYDSDCDGIGDFNGITQKLDYLQDLGVTALWLMPIHPSPSYHGYDVTNYYAVNYEYGSLEDFQNLVNEVHKRGMHIIIDLVINHTSDQHPWFVDARSFTNSAYRDWYIWSETYPGYNGPLGVAWHKSDTGYYYGVFCCGMADLNYTNPEVTAQMEKIASYWLIDVGVDGFRVDAAKHLIEEGENQENTESTHEWFRNFYTFYKTEKPDAYTVGEVKGAGAFFAKTYTGDQFDNIFNFDIGYGIVNSARNGNNQAVLSAMNFSIRDMPEGDYATFLTNHDQDRAMQVLGGDMNRAKVAASLLLTAQGIPYIYYGEEIGQIGKKPDEDIRRPMQWSDATNAGFTCPDATPWRPSYDAAQVNVVAELADPDSLWSHYQTLIAIRKAHPALRTGDNTLIDTDQKAIFASLRTSQDEQVLVIVNLGDEPIDSYQLSVGASPLKRGTYSFEGVLGSLDQTLKVNKGGGFELAVDTLIQPYQTLILVLQ